MCWHIGHIKQESGQKVTKYYARFLVTLLFSLFSISPSWNVQTDMWYEVKDHTRDISWEKMWIDDIITLVIWPKHIWQTRRYLLASGKIHKCCFLKYTCGTIQSPYWSNLFPCNCTRYHVHYSCFHRIILVRFFQE